MSLFLKTIGYYLLGTLFLIFQGIAVIFAGVYHLWEYLRYQVQVFVGILALSGTSSALSAATGRNVR